MLSGEISRVGLCCFSRDKSSWVVQCSTILSLPQLKQWMLKSPSSTELVKTSEIVGETREKSNGHQIKEEQQVAGFTKKWGKTIGLCKHCE